MRWFLVVALALGSACGREEPEIVAAWSWSAASGLTCPTADRREDPRVSSWYQECLWDCATYQGVRHQGVWVRYDAQFDETAFRERGEWILLGWTETVHASNRALCHLFPTL